MSPPPDFFAWLAERDCITYTQARGLFEALRALRPLAENDEALFGLETWCQQQAAVKLREAIGKPASHLNEAARAFGEGEAWSGMPAAVKDFVERLMGDYEEWEALTRA